MRAFLKGNKVVYEFEVGNVDEELLLMFSAMEIGSKSKAKEEDIVSLSDEIVRKWWDENKDRFLKSDENSG